MYWQLENVWSKYGSARPDRANNRPIKTPHFHEFASVTDLQWTLLKFFLNIYIGSACSILLRPLQYTGNNNNIISLPSVAMQLPISVFTIVFFFMLCAFISCSVNITEFLGNLREFGQKSTARNRYLKFCVMNAGDKTLYRTRSIYDKNY